MRRGIIVTLALGLSACSSAPPPYPQPSDNDAKEGMIAGIRADLIDEPAQHDIPDDPVVDADDTPREAMAKVGGTMQSLSESNDRADARKRINQLAEVEIKACEWGSADADSLRAYGRQRIEQVTAAYMCTYRVFSDTTTRGKVFADGSGYFYRDGEQWLQATIDQSSWEEVGS